MKDVDFTPQGMPDDSNDKSSSSPPGHKRWEQIVFAVEEVEGMVKTSDYITRRTEVRRDLKIDGTMEDTVFYRKKPLLHFKYTDMTDLNNFTVKKLYTKTK